MADALVGLVVICTITIPNLPGRINADTWGMLRQAREGEITDWHAPLVQLVWQTLDRLIPMGVLFGLQTVVLVVSTTVVLRHLACPAMARIGTAVLWLNPIGYALATGFTRDTWMVTAYIALLASLLVLKDARDELALRDAGLRAIGFPLLSCVLWAGLCLASRQNSAALLVPLAFVLAWNARHRHRLVAGLAAAVVALLAPLVILQQLYRVLPIEESGPETAIMLADLDEYSSSVGQIHVPAVATSPGLTLEDLEELSSIYVPDMLWYGPQPERVFVELGPAARAEVRDAWVEMVTEHPGHWVRIRAKLFLRQVGISGPTMNTYLPAEIDNDQGIRSTFPHLAQKATGWLESIQSPGSRLGPWVTRAWIWLFAAAAAAVWLARHRRPGTVVAVAAWLYALSAFPGGTGVQYRFVIPAVVLCQGVLVAAAGVAVSRSTRTAPGTPCSGARVPHAQSQT